MIENYIKGDLIQSFLNGDLEAIGHGCNCCNIMGNGVALTIKKTFPGAFKSDLEYYNKVPLHFMLGTYSFSETDYGVVYNLYTQPKPGKFAKLEYIKQCFSKLNNDIPNQVLGIPLIGCGLGGLKWEEVSEVINEVTPNLPIIVYKL